MPPRPFLLLSAACAVALGCVAHLPYYERALELTSSGDPYGPGGTQNRIADVLVARHYTVQHFDMRAPRYEFYLSGHWAPWGIRLRADGWDQIDVIRTSGSHGYPGAALVSNHWTVRARTFASDGAEHPPSVEAQADVDSVMAELNTVGTRERAPDAGALTGPESNRDNVWIGTEGTCAGGRRVGAFVALPPWAGAPDRGRNADRIAATLEAGGWTIARRFPVAELGMLVAERRQSAGSDGLTVLAIRAEDPSRYGVRTWYEVRTASCDSAGRRGPPRAEARAAADRLLAALRDAIAGER
jgi:hypothetical protein